MPLKISITIHKKTPSKNIIRVFDSSYLVNALVVDLASYLVKFAHAHSWTNTNVERSCGRGRRREYRGEGFGIGIMVPESALRAEVWWGEIIVARLGPVGTVEYMREAVECDGKCVKRRT